MMHWIITGVLTGAVVTLWNRVTELERILRDKDPGSETPGSVNNTIVTNTASDEAAKAVDRHVQAYHRGQR